jgi:hypothetical protein
MRLAEPLGLEPRGAHVYFSLVGFQSGFPSDQFFQRGAQRFKAKQKFVKKL